MKKTTITLACALIAPLAFAQTSSTTTQSTSTNPVTGTSETTTTTTSTDGTVTTFTPGKTIVVKPTAADPISYALGKTVRFVNKAGREIKEEMIKPGARVHVYYDNTGETHVVNRVVVDED
jgi:ABC-type Fe3+-hydroxamate transport system substrate-binding protein